MAKKAVSASTIDPDAPEKETVAHYLVARREWLERYGDYIAQAKNWRIAAPASMAVMMTDTSILLRRGLLLEYIGTSSEPPSSLPQPSLHTLWHLRTLAWTHW